MFLVYLPCCLTIITNSRTFPSHHKYLPYLLSYALILPKVSPQIISVAQAGILRWLAGVNLQGIYIVRKQESYIAQKDTEPKLLAFLAIRLM